MLISTALLLDINTRSSVCTPAKLPCRRVVEGSELLTTLNSKINASLEFLRFFEEFYFKAKNCYTH
jgi:hypothetical protein